jgi:hypothetical protein
VLGKHRGKTSDVADLDDENDEYDGGVSLLDVENKAPTDSTMSTSAIADVSKPDRHCRTQQLWSSPKWRVKLGNWPGCGAGTGNAAPDL